jgi:hypothetical protein
MWARIDVTFRRIIQQRREFRSDSDGTELAIHSSDLPTAQLSTCNADRTVEKKWHCNSRSDSTSDSPFLRQVAAQAKKDKVSSVTLVAVIKESE